MINLIVAYDQQRAIGKDGHLLWEPGEMREDMKRFRTLTRDTTVIMGRRTLESIGMALPNRQNIVLTHSTKTAFENVDVAGSFEEALAKRDNEDVFVIGGEQIYVAALDEAQRIYATEVHMDIGGADTFFPNLDSGWTVSSRESHESDENNRYPYDFVTYEREKSGHFVNIANVRSREQQKVFEEIAQEGECPFCGDNFERYNQEIVRRGENWMVAPNLWPYDNTDTHLIVVPTYHAEILADLKANSFNELLEHLQWAEKEYNVKAGGVAMRFGDVTLNGSSVKHLHAHFIVPALDKPVDVKVRFKIS